MSSATTLPPKNDMAIRLADDRRGTGGMILTITTEAALFLVLVFAYIFLAQKHWHGATLIPPKLTLALVMLAVLLTSSAVLHWGEKKALRGRHRTARVALVLTALMGVLFLSLQYTEYQERLKVITPQTSSYGSIFFAITGLHGLHVVVGLSMLLYAASLPRLEPATRPPHRPYHNVALYWHFVDAVWIVIVAMLYVAPNLR